MDDPVTTGRPRRGVSARARQVEVESSKNDRKTTEAHGVAMHTPTRCAGPTDWLSCHERPLRPNLVEIDYFRCAGGHVADELRKTERADDHTIIRRPQSQLAHEDGHDRHDRAHRQAAQEHRASQGQIRRSFEPSSRMVDRNSSQDTRYCLGPCLSCRSTRATPPCGRLRRPVTAPKSWPLR